MNDHNFTDRLAWSKGLAGKSDAATIKNLLSGCVLVESTCKELDMLGIDFIAKLRGGAILNVDVKRRAKGVSRHWKPSPTGEIEPELTLEYWSVCPKDGQGGKVGWTLDESKLTDYILYVFDPADTQEAFLLPFQLLRIAFRKNLKQWGESFRVGKCSTESRYETESYFVPAWCVLEAISSEMRVTVLEADNG